MADRRLTPDLLLTAYASGIFPMAEKRDDPDVYWVDPRARGVMPLDAMHLSRSLARAVRRGDYRVTLNTDLDGVMDGCADRAETWINGTIRSLTRALFDLGNAQTLEVRRDGRLIGGVYGVTLGSAFFGESMFSRERDASKIALVWLVDHLRECGFTLFDTQFVTPHLASLGAREISRADYHLLLKHALSRPRDFRARPVCDDPQAVVQRMIQTS